MMVANSFDLWQKDSFFSAAEEVQESADAYVSLFLVFFFFFFGFYSCGSATLVFSCQILRFVGFGDVRTRIYVFGDVGIELRYKRSRICVKFFILWGLMMRVWIILQSLICFYWFCFNGASEIA
jgi:hypothetical protein